MSILTLSLVLFFIIDPFGKINGILTVLDGVNNPKRVLMREMGIALGVMIAFNYLGEVLFHLLGLSDPTLNLSAGVILFLAALRILFPPAHPIIYHSSGTEPFLVPIAIPMIAGPALLATIMLFAHLEESQAVMLIAIAIAWVGAMLVLLAAPMLKRIFGNNGITAAERLMAMILAMLAIQRIMDGVHMFVEIHAPQ